MREQYSGRCKGRERGGQGEVRGRGPVTARELGGRRGRKKENGKWGREEGRK